MVKLKRKITQIKTKQKLRTKLKTITQNKFGLNGEIRKINFYKRVKLKKIRN